MPNRTHGKTALFLGVLIGWIWLYPVFMAPNVNFTNNYQDSVWRYGRSTCLMLCAFLCNYKASLRHLMSGHNFMIHFLFLVFPFLSLCVVPDLSFLLYACAPLWLAGISLLVLAGVDERDRKAAILGVSLAALGFLCVGLARYGLTEMTFYGRGRTHMGFIHPIYSAGAIVASSYFFFSITAKFLGRQSTPAACFHLANFVVTGWLLVLAESRNALLAYCIFLGSYFTISFASKHRWLHRSIKLSMVGVFLIFMTYSAVAVREGEIYTFLNNASSLRIDLNSRFFEAFQQNLTLTSLWGETDGLPTASVVVRKTFVSYDSLLVTTLANFGLLFSMLFYLWYLLRGVSAFRSKNAVNFAAWTSFFFISIFDAQGLTPSNIIIFFLLFRIYEMPSKGEQCLLLTDNQVKL